MKPALQVIAEAMNEELMMYDDDLANAATIMRALNDAGYIVAPAYLVKTEVAPVTRSDR